MKQFTGFAIMAIVILLFSSNANAWAIDIENNTTRDIEIFGYGEHLFWNNIVDCSSLVLKKSSGQCGLDFALCPVKVQVKTRTEWKKPDQYVDIPSIGARCYHTKIILVEDTNGKITGRWIPW